MKQTLHPRHPDSETILRPCPSGANNGRAWVEPAEEVAEASEGDRHPASTEHLQPLSEQDLGMSSLFALAEALSECQGPSRIADTRT